MTALETAVLLGSKREYVHYNLGFAYARQGRWQEAEVAFKSALELSRALEPRIGLSFVLYKQDRYEEALKATEEAVHLQPDSWEARFHQTQPLDALARFDEATETYGQVFRFRLNPLPTVLKRMRVARAIPWIKKGEVGCLFMSKAKMCRGGRRCSRERPVKAPWLSQKPMATSAV